MESEREKIEYSRSNPLDYIETQRKVDQENQRQAQILGVGVHEMDEQCKKKGLSCKSQFVVKLDLKCSTNENKEYFDVLVPFRFKEVDVDIVDKSSNGLNGHFPLKLQSGPNGELSFSIDSLGDENSKFILRRNRRQMNLSIIDAKNSIILPVQFCSN